MSISNLGDGWHGKDTKSNCNMENKRKEMYNLCNYLRTIEDNFPQYCRAQQDNKAHKVTCTEIFCGKLT